MNELDKAFGALCAQGKRAPDDYANAEGLLMCGKCHTPKQADIPYSHNARRLLSVPIPCECAREQIEADRQAQAQRDHQMRVDALRRDGLADPDCSTRTFANDDCRQPGITALCKNYVDNWAQMRESNMGLLFYGGVGTGKSYYACCIANALIDMGVSVLVTSFPRILSKLQDAGRNGGRSDLLNRVQWHELVVIDDLGVERDTEYAVEQMYAVVDARYCSGKPLIVTTNLAPSDIKKPDNIGYERIFSRIMQNCEPILVNGISRREEIAEKKRVQCRSLLGLQPAGKK